jgi:hypothetical protein
MTRCDSQKAIERLIKNKTLTPSNILEIEVHLRKCISVCSDLNKVLNKHLVSQKRQQDEIDDPTTTEETRKAWWRR